jgi:hypothetical protein
MAAPHIRRGSQSVNADCDIAEEEEYYVTRPHTSVRRYQQPVRRDTLDDYEPDPAVFVQRRRVSGVGSSGGIISQAVTPVPAVVHPKRRRTPWLALSVGMLLMLALVAGLSLFGSWWQVHQNDATYGRPRTYQVDAIVGHLDSASRPSHFLFMNFNHRVIIVEFPGGDTARALIYTGPALLGTGDDLIPVTGGFRDVNGDGRLDMIVHIQDQTIVFINDGAKFRPLQPGEHVTF